MNKKRTAKRKAKHSVFLLWSGAVIGLAVITFGILWLVGALTTTSDGASFSQASAHQLTAAEKHEVSTAVHSQTNPYPCVNNTADTCINNPFVQYYPVGFSSNLYLEDYQPSYPTTIKQIYGKVISFSDTQVKLLTSTKQTITIQFPAGTAAAAKNAGYSYSLDAPNNTMLVTYQEPRDQHYTTLDVSQIAGVTIGNKSNVKPSDWLW